MFPKYRRKTREKFKPVLFYGGARENNFAGTGSD